MDKKVFNERLMGVFQEHSLNLNKLPRRDLKSVKIYKSWAGANNYILDLGCGTGVLSKLFMANSNKVVGLDISSQAVEEAKKCGVNAIVHDVETSLPFEDNTFDRVMCNSVIEHLLEPEKTVKEIYRVLKSQGSVLFATPNSTFWRQRFMLSFFGIDANVESYFWERLYPWNNPHIRFFSVKTLKEFLFNNGFKIDNVWGTFTSFPGAIAGYFPKIIRYPLAFIDIVTFGFDFLADLYPPLFSAGIILEATKP